MNPESVERVSTRQHVVGGVWCGWSPERENVFAADRISSSFSLPHSIPAPVSHGLPGASSTGKHGRLLMLCGKPSKFWDPEFSVHGNRNPLMFIKCSKCHGKRQSPHFTGRNDRPVWERNESGMRMRDRDQFSRHEKVMCSRITDNGASEELILLLSCITCIAD